MDVGKALPSNVIIVEVFTDKFIFVSGEPITIYIAVINPTDSPIKLGFSSTFQFITSSETYLDIKYKIYQWSGDKLFLQILTQIRISPRGYYLTNFTHKSTELLLSPGMSSIEGVVVGYGSDITQIVVVSTSLIILIVLIATAVVLIGVALWESRKN